MAPPILRARLSKFRGPFFQARDVTHKEEAIAPPGTPERMAIIFDLKDVSVPPVTRPGLPTAFPREGATTPAIDNVRVLEWDYTWLPERMVAMHIHDRDAVQVFASGGTIRFTSEDGSRRSRLSRRKTRASFRAGPSMLKRRPAVRRVR